MSVHAEPQLNIDQHFDDMVANYQQWSQTNPEEDDHITVMLNLPHLAKYGRPTTVELVYGCTFPVAVGDAVLCPPTPRGEPTWTTGVVVALDGRGYKGPVKYVRKINSSKDEK